MHQILLGALDHIVREGGGTPYKLLCFGTKFFI